MKRPKNQPETGSTQQQGWDRTPTESPEKVKKASQEAQSDQNKPKEQPDHNQPEPKEDFSHNQTSSDMSKKKR